MCRVYVKRHLTLETVVRTVEAPDHLTSEPDMTNARTEAIANADAHLANVGLPSYTELLGLLVEAQSMGLTFDRGSAYISSAYIDHQERLNRLIGAAVDAVNG